MGVIDLGTLGGTNAIAWGTRDRQVVGQSTLSGDLTEHAFAWSLARGMIDLGSLGGTPTFADALSGRFVVGTGTTIDGQTCIPLVAIDRAGLTPVVARRH